MFFKAEYGEYRILSSKISFWSVDFWALTYSFVANLDTLERWCGSLLCSFSWQAQQQQEGEPSASALPDRQDPSHSEVGLDWFCGVPFEIFHTVGKFCAIYSICLSIQLSFFFKFVHFFSGHFNFFILVLESTCVPSCSSWHHIVVYLEIQVESHAAKRRTFSVLY